MTDEPNSDMASPGCPDVDEALTAPVTSRDAEHEGTGAAVATRVGQRHDDRYEVASTLGKGGMGEVIEVLDHEFNRRVAMKTLLHAQVSREEMDLFVAEAQINSQLEHPNMVPVHDIGIGADGKPFFTMRLVRGHTSLKTLIERLEAGDPATHKAFSFERRVQLVQQVCHALEYAHQRGVIHCDIKPENIVLGDCGELFVVDWGISQLIAQDEQAHPHGAIETSDALEETDASHYGTAQYMAPERMMCPGDVEANTDIYSLTAVLYELLSLNHYLGDVRGKNRVGALCLLLEGKRASAESHFHRINGRVPRTLSQICRKGLSREPTARYQSAGELREALQAWLEGRIPMVCPGTTIQRGLAGISRIIDRYPVGAPAVIIVAMAGTASVVVMAALQVLSG